LSVAQLYLICRRNLLVYTTGITVIYSNSSEF